MVLNTAAPGFIPGPPVQIRCSTGNATFEGKTRRPGVARVGGPAVQTARRAGWRGGVGYTPLATRSRIQPVRDSESDTARARLGVGYSACATRSRIQRVCESESDTTCAR